MAGNSEEQGQGFREGIRVKSPSWIIKIFRKEPIIGLTEYFVTVHTRGMLRPIQRIQAEKKTRNLRKIVLAVLLYALSMDAVIDAIDIWNGNYNLGIGYHTIGPRPHRPFMREHEGLFTGSYFEAQTQVDQEGEYLPSKSFHLIVSSEIQSVQQERDRSWQPPLLCFFLLSLPPPFLPVPAVS